MTRLDETEADDLLAAYALDALPEAEARRVEEHLRSCAEHRAAAAELRQTGSMLSLTNGSPGAERLLPLARQIIGQARSG